MAILLSGTATAVCGPVAGGAAGVVGLCVAGFCCAETQNAAAVNSATAAKERAIFMTFLNYSLLEGSWTKLLVVRPATTVGSGDQKVRPTLKRMTFFSSLKKNGNPSMNWFARAFGLYAKIKRNGTLMTGTWTLTSMPKLDL